MRQEIELKTTLNTDTFDQGIKKFGEEAPNIVNTGIERDGGITNIYKTETDFSDVGQHYITDDGRVLSVVDGATDYKEIRLDGKAIGQTSAYGVEKRLYVKGVDDIFLDTASYITCSLTGATITITEYDYNQAVLNTRDVVFTGLTAVLPFFTSLSFVRYNGMKYADSLEWALRLGPQVVILQESNPGITVNTALQSTSVLGSNQINTVTVYKGTLVFAGVGGRVGSFDGSAWKNYDGSGTGTGIYNAGDATLGVIGSNDIKATCIYTKGAASWIVFAGVGGRVGSYDGTVWKNWNSGGTISNNATVVSTDTITAMCQYSTNLVIASALGKLGSWNGLTWVLYNAGSGLCDNATLIGAASINSVFTMTDKDGGATLIAAGAGGKLGSMKLAAGTTWATGTTTLSYARCVAYGSGIFVVGGDYGKIWISTDGQTWESIITGITNQILEICYGGGYFIIISGGRSYRSADGRTWTQGPLSLSSPRSLSFGNGVYVCAKGFEIYSSSDGLTWTLKHTATYYYSGIAYGNGTYVACGDNGQISYSTDLNTWTDITVTGNNWQCICWGYDKFVVIASGTAAQTSPNGITWTARTVPNGNWANVTYGNRRFTAISGTGGANISSADGITWSSNTTISGAWQGICFGCDRFVGVSTSSSFVLIGNVSVKSIFSATSSYDMPTNNATVISTYPIYTVNVFNNYLFVGGGTTLSYSGSMNLATGTWYNYNSAGYLTDNGTILATPILTSCLFGSNLVVAGASGRLGSWNTAGTMTVYTSSTGIASNGGVIGANTITSMASYNSVLAIAGASGIVNTMDSAGFYSPFYADGAIVITNLLDGFAEQNYLYAYRYENGEYLINLVGNSLNKSYTLNNTTRAIKILTCKYAIPQVYNGVSRHIVSASDTAARHIYTASEIQCTGLVGYTDFSTYSGSVVYPSAAYVLGNGYVLDSQAGYGYSDFTFRTTASATNIFNYCPQFKASTLGLYQVNQSNTDTLINAYGKLTNNYELTPSKPFEIRVCWINGVQSYLSAGLLDSIQQDSLGVLLTNVGEFDETFQPMIVTDDTIVHQYEGSFIITKIGKTIPQYIQRIDANVYKINSISPLNVIDMVGEALTIGSVDFNNRMIFTNTVSPPSSAINIASYIQGKYSNSIDTGNKLVTITSPTAANVELIGYRIPVVTTSTKGYAIDTYFEDVYAFSTFNNGEELVDAAKVDTLYVTTTTIPLTLAVSYGSGVATIGNYTIFTKPGYDGYTIGNYIDGLYVTFSLFGQLYLYDGKAIYAATVDSVSGLFSSKVAIASGYGLQFIASSPTEAFFLSAFDNSLYSFNGGRTLDKKKRFTQMEPINFGVFDVVENTLVLDTANTFVFMRDSIITLNEKEALQTGLKYYSTTQGLIIANDLTKWRYTYNPVDLTSVVVPLSLQTGYYGFENVDKSILKAFYVTIYNEQRTVMNVGLSVFSVLPDKDETQTEQIQVKPGDYNEGGYVRLRIQPGQQRALATSLKIDIAEKCIVSTVIAEIAEAETATVAPSRSV